VEPEDGIVDTGGGFEVTISDASEEARIARLIASNLS